MKSNDLKVNNLYIVKDYNGLSTKLFKMLVVEITKESLLLKNEDAEIMPFRIEKHKFDNNYFIMEDLGSSLTQSSI